MTDKEVREAIDAWLLNKKSPMYGTADYGWVLARFYGISGSLSIAIAQAETGCGADPDADQIAIKGHNAWGYGHPPGSHGHSFPSWPDGVCAVTNELHKFVYGLYDKYPACETVLNLSGIWVNGDINKPNPTWTANVSSIMRFFGGDPNKLHRTALYHTPSGPGPV